MDYTNKQTKTTTDEPNATHIGLYSNQIFYFTLWLIKFYTNSTCVCNRSLNFKAKTKKAPDI